MPSHITNAVNVAGYASWGFHSELGSFYPANRLVVWSGNSSWYLIKTEESHNGMRFADSGNFLQWFAPGAFGGLDYANTPVGAVSFVDEPGAGAVNSADYFQLWALGRTLALSAWNSTISLELQVVGDPFVAR